MRVEVKGKMRVEVKGKVIPTSFPPKKRGIVRRCVKAEREGQYVELVGNQSIKYEAPPRSKRGGRKEDARRGVSARRMMEKS